MKMSGFIEIAADRQAVWDGLNDAEVLRIAVPGCEELEKADETRFTAIAKQKIGPVSARFKGEIELKDLQPPVSYRIEGEGKGGVAGFAKGGADVRLEEISGGGTRLHYDVEAKVGGKMAQLGARLIDATAKKLADQFFTKFREELEKPLD